MASLSSPHPLDSVILEAWAGDLQLPNSFIRVSSFSFSLTVLRLGPFKSAAQFNNRPLLSLLYHAIKLQELRVTVARDEKDKPWFVVSPQRHPNLHRLFLDGVHLEGDLSTLRELTLIHHPGGLLDWGSFARMLNTATNLQNLTLIGYSLSATACGPKTNDEHIVRLPHLSSLALPAAPEILVTTISCFPYLPTQVNLQAKYNGGIEDITRRNMNIFSNMLSSGLGTGLPPAFRHAHCAELSFIRGYVRLILTYPDRRELCLNIDLPYALCATASSSSASVSSSAASSSSAPVSAPAPDPARLAAMYNAVFAAAAWTCSGAPIATFKCTETPEDITDDTWAFVLRTLDRARVLAVGQRPRVPGQSIMSLFRAMAKCPPPTPAPAPAQALAQAQDKVEDEDVYGPRGLRHVQVRGTAYSAELLETMLKAVRAQRLERFELELCDAWTGTGQGEAWYKGEPSGWELKLREHVPMVCCASFSPSSLEEYEARLAAAEQEKAKAQVQAQQATK